MVSCVSVFENPKTEETTLPSRPVDIDTKQPSAQASGSFSASPPRLPDHLPTSVIHGQPTGTPQGEKDWPHCRVI